MTVTCMISGTNNSDRAALDYAATLARRFGQPFSGMCALPDPTTALIYATSPYMIGVGGPALDGVRKAQEALVADCEDMFKAAAAEASLTDKATFTHETNLPARAAVSAATLADAIVFPHEAGSGEHVLAEAFERTMMDSALPVVLAAAEMNETGRALIAWDGSPQAARAVRLHLPLLQLMDEVVIAQNPDDIGQLAAQNPAASPEALTSWLTARGISAETVAFSGSVATGLIEAAASHRCELIVSGAYGSSRAGEMLFGGATRGLLKTAGAPALALAH